MLDSRYEDLKSGRVKPIDGEAFLESLLCREDELIEKHRAEMSVGQAFDLHPLNSAGHFISRFYSGPRPGYGGIKD